ncbi:MAG TPA: hypothetical protein G4O08_01450 [Anaerolineae bacterium]|nr:hypothetical protein [Anaerolineae bacterium]
MQDPGSTRPTTSLGDPISDHGLRRELRLLYLYLGVVGFGGALVMVTLGIWRAYLAYQNYGPALVWRWSTPSWIAAAALAVIGLVSLFILWRRQDMKIRLYANGMAYRRGGQVEVLFWRQVRAIRTSASRYLLPILGTRTRSELTLIMVGRKPVRLTGYFEDLNQLMKTVKEQIYPRLMADYVKAFRLGQPTVFGPLTLTTGGIQHGKRSIPWKKVRGIDIERGKMIILWKSNEHISRLSVPTTKIPNVEICYQFIRRLGQQP